MRAKPKKGKAATGEVFVAENPMQDKLNGMYLKALESPRRPKPTLTEEEKERQSAIAKEYIRNLWWRHNEISIDMDMKMEMRMEAITALPSEAMQLAALMTPQDPSVPIDYRAVLERPPAEGWHRPRVSQAAQDLADADDYFKAQAALDGAISGQGVTDADAAALGEGAELNEDGEKARRQSKSK